MLTLYFIWHWFTGWLFSLGGIGGVVAIGAWALWFFTPDFLLTSKNTVFMVAVGATVWVVGFTYADTRAYNRGYTTAINAVKAHDAKINAQGNGAWSDVEACFASGREWNVATDSCGEPQ